MVEVEIARLATADSSVSLAKTAPDSTSLWAILDLQARLDPPQVTEQAKRVISGLQDYWAEDWTRPGRSRVAMKE